MKQRSIQIESKTEELIAVRDFVSLAAQEFGFSDEDVSKIALAVDEACTNVIKHAYRYDVTKDLKVSIRGKKNSFEVTIHDNGRIFDPNGVKPPDMKEYLSHFRKGGLGVYLMKSLMDKVEYDIKPGSPNQVRLTKYLQSKD